MRKIKMKTILILVVVSAVAYLFWAAPPPLQESKMTVQVEQKIVPALPENCVPADKYVLSEYQKNAQLTGTRLAGTGFDEELSIEEKIKKEKEAGTNTWSFTEFSFCGENYRLVCGIPAIYGGENFKDVICGLVGKYCREAVLVETRVRDEPFLVVFIEHSTKPTKQKMSSFLILDRDFRQVFREEISGKPYEFGIFRDDQNEECFYLRNIDKKLEFRIYKIVDFQLPPSRER